MNYNDNKIQVHNARRNALQYHTGNNWIMMIVYLQCNKDYNDYIDYNKVDTVKKIL